MQNQLEGSLCQLLFFSRVSMAAWAAASRAMGGAADVAEPGLEAEPDRCRVTAVFSADAHL